MGKGRTGTSLGGNVVRVERRTYEKNTAPCKVCGSVKGEPCRAVKPGHIGFLYKTHVSRPEPNWLKRKPEDFTETPPTVEGFVPRNRRPASEGGKKGWSRNDWMKN